MAFGKSTMVENKFVAIDRDATPVGFFTQADYEILDRSVKGRTDAIEAVGFDVYNAAR